MALGYTAEDLGDAYQVVDEVGDLSMRFARTFRLPTLPDGRHESDSEHSQTLALVALELASRYYPELDLGRVALLSVVHDLDEIEADGGDTPTLWLTQEGLTAKKQREAEGRLILRSRYPFANNLFDLLDGYEPEGEKLDDEAAFVFIVDKIVPSVTHMRNHGEDLRQIGISSGKELWKSVETTQQRLEPFRSRFPLLLALRELRLQRDAEMLDS